MLPIKSYLEGCTQRQCTTYKRAFQRLFFKKSKASHGYLERLIATSLSSDDNWNIIDATKTFMWKYEFSLWLRGHLKHLNPVSSERLLRSLRDSINSVARRKGIFNIQSWPVCLLKSQQQRLQAFNCITKVCLQKAYLSRNMRFQTMWYVQPAKAQLLLVAWIFYDC